MAGERFGSKTDVVVKLTLVFFIALLSFSIGTFVGKKFSDNQHKLAALETGHGDALTAEESQHKSEHDEARGIASISPDVGEVKPEKALSDDEISKLAEEFITDDEKPHATKEDGHEPQDIAAHGEAEHKAEHKTEKPAAAESHGGHEAHGATAEVPKKNTKEPVAALIPAVRLAEGKTPIVDNPTPTPSRIPSSLPKEVASSAIGKFTVQIASYSQESEAQAMAADLKSKGFSAFYVSAKIKGQIWYRVSVGLFTTTKEAEIYKKDLMIRAGVSSALIQKITAAE